jgi:hypothetical protein
VPASQQGIWCGALWRAKQQSIQSMLITALSICNRECNRAIMESPPFLTFCLETLLLLGLRLTSRHALAPSRKNDGSQTPTAPRSHFGVLGVGTVSAPIAHAR